MCPLFFVVKTLVLTTTRVIILCVKTGFRDYKMMLF